MCENLANLLNNCHDSQDEITYISIRNKILIGLGSKWSFKDLINIILESKIDYGKFKILVEIIERRDGWNLYIPQLIECLQITDNEGVFYELKLSLLYHITINFDEFYDIITSKFNIFITVLNEIFDKIQIGSLKFIQRNIFFTTITKLVDISLIKDKPLQNDLHDKINLNFCIKVCDQIRGEKDPRNLLLMFPLLKKLLMCVNSVENAVGNSVDICNEISQILLTYYPINFKPPKNAPQSITEDDLIIALNDALSYNLLWKYVIDVLIDGLYCESDDESLDFLEKNVKTIVYCIPHYGNECTLQYLPQIVEVISTECFLSSVEYNNVIADLAIDIDYEIRDEVINCDDILSLDKWIPNRKQRLLSEVLQTFLKHLLVDNNNDIIWRNISFLLDIVKNSILSNNNDVITSLHMAKIIAFSSPDCIFDKISEFLDNIIAQIPLKSQYMNSLAYLMALSLLRSNKKVKSIVAGKVHQLLIYIQDSILHNVEEFVDIVKVINKLVLPEDFVLSICNKLNNATNFDINCEEIIVNLSQQEGCKFINSLFQSIQNCKPTYSDSCLDNITNGTIFFDYLSDNTSLLNYSPENLSRLYNRINDVLLVKRCCFIWTLSVIILENIDDCYWYKYAKSLASIDIIGEHWLCKMTSPELFEKVEFLHLLEDITNKYSPKILQHILQTYHDNIYKLFIIPWLPYKLVQNVQEKEMVQNAFYDLVNVQHFEELRLSLLPILIQDYDNTIDTIPNLLSLYPLQVYIFSLIKRSELTSTDLWTEYMKSTTKTSQFHTFFTELSLLLDELCPFRIIPGETWQLVLDTWINPHNYRKSIRITENMNRNITLKNVLLDKIYYIDCHKCEQRISFANYILCNIVNKYLTGNNDHKLNAHRCFIKLLSSMPPDSIDKELIPNIFESIELMHSDWDDLRLLCLIAKLARHKLLNSYLQTINMNLIVNYCSKKRTMALSRTISLLVIKEIWNLLQSSLELDLCNTVIEYVSKCGKDSNKRVRRMALSTRQTVKFSNN